MSALRLGVCLLLAAERFFVRGSGPRLLAGDPGEALSLLGLLGGVVFSLWTFHRLRRGTAPRWLPELSAAGDALFVSLVMLPILVWAGPEWPGVLGRPTWAFLLIALISSGFRISRVAVGLSTALTGSSLVAQVLLDGRLHGPAVLPSAEVATLAGVAWLTGAGIAWGITARTRTLVAQGAQAALKAERARQRLGVYVSQEIADAAIDSELLRPGGERRSVAVLFSDLRGFTGWGEQISPERLIDELNAYLDAMVGVIRQERGVVDKYIGDAIMVVFGIPGSAPDDAARALRCARRMQAALADHNEDRARRGLPPLRHGIGVHHGDVVAGNVGTDDRVQYTVVGDVVNTASRIEGATKTLGVPVLITDELVQAVGGDPASLGLQPCGSVPIRGRSAPVVVYTLVDDPCPWPQGE